MGRWWCSEESEPDSSYSASPPHLTQDPFSADPLHSSRWLMISTGKKTPHLCILCIWLDTRIPEDSRTTETVSVQGCEMPDWWHYASYCHCEQWCFYVLAGCVCVFFRGAKYLDCAGILWGKDCCTLHCVWKRAKTICRSEALICYSFLKRKLTYCMTYQHKNCNTLKARQTTWCFPYFTEHKSFFIWNIPWLIFQSNKQNIGSVPDERGTRAQGYLHRPFTWW